jgi:hypothetical protein
VRLDRGDDGDEPGRRPSAARERQIERLLKRAERVERWLQENGPKMGRQGREIKSNVTDNESAIMVTSHGTIQGYNGQALVEYAIVFPLQLLITGGIARVPLGRSTKTEYFLPFVELGDQLCRNQLKPVNGYIPLPKSPGLGLDMDEAALARYPYKPFPLRKLPFPEDEGKSAGF